MAAIQRTLLTYLADALTRIAAGLNAKLKPPPLIQHGGIVVITSEVLEFPTLQVPEITVKTDFRTLAIEVATALSARFEGLYLAPYLCPAGVPTIGYGATYYPDGRRVTMKDPPITEEYAKALLTWMVTKVYLPAVLKHCPNIDTPGRLAAIIDWTFNLGEGNLAASTMKKRVNAGLWPEARSEMKRWNKASGKVLKGLTRRRDAEIALT